MRAVREIAPPALLAEALRDDRIGHQLDVGHDAAELGQAARHVIARGDDDQLGEPLVGRPLHGLVGVARRVLRLIADIDAALEHLPRDAALAMQVFAAGDAVGAGDQQSVAAPVGQQARRFGQPVAAAGQHDDAVCALDRGWRRVGDTAREHNEASQEHQDHRAHGYGDTSACSCHDTSPDCHLGVSNDVPATSLADLDGLVTGLANTVNRASRGCGVNADCSECDKRRSGRSACTAQRSPGRRCRAGNSRADRAPPCRSGAGSR